MQLPAHGVAKRIWSRLASAHNHNLLYLFFLSLLRCWDVAVFKADVQGRTCRILILVFFLEDYIPLPLFQLLVLFSCTYLLSFSLTTLPLHFMVSRMNNPEETIKTKWKIVCWRKGGNGKLISTISNYFEQLFNSDGSFSSLF